MPNSLPNFPHAQTTSSIEQYGHFLEDEGCFELITEPPRKWRNIHFSEPGDTEYYIESTHIGDGLSRVRFRDGLTLNLAAYDHKTIYIRDEDSGQVFSPAGMPAIGDIKNYSCRFYPEKTVIQSHFDGLEVSWRTFVPNQHPFEAWTLSIRNLSQRKRRLSIFSYVLMPLDGVDQEGQSFSRHNTSKIHLDEAAVVVSNRNIQRFAKGKIQGFMTCLQGIVGASGYRDHFTRADYSLSAPKIMWGWNCSNQNGAGPDCSTILQSFMELEPDQEDRRDYLLGHCENGINTVKMHRESIDPDMIDKLCQERAHILKEQSQAFWINTGGDNKHRDALLNLFVKKQMSSYLIDKSGFRDNLQTDCAVALYNYPMAKANFLKALGSQKLTGEVLHSFRPYNRLTYADKPAWILMTVPWLIKESGDYDMLQEIVPYFESSQEGTVWEHVETTLDYLSRDLGRRGLSKQHFADWNDGLEPSEKTGERESVMVSQQLCFGCLEVADLAQQIGDRKIEDKCKMIFESMSHQLNKHAWDGEWYLRSLCEDGYPLGSHQHQEAKIFLNTQAWAVISATAKGERAEACMNSVEKYCSRPEGYVICDPPLTSFDDRIGRFSTIMPKTNTNGGCYCHASAFKALADCIMKRPEEAWSTYLKNAPDNPENPISRSGMEPFSFVNKFDLLDESPGASGYAWKTGTAPWYAMIVIEWILGVRRDYPGLLIDPCLSKKVPIAKLTRSFRGAKYHISFDNTAGRCHGVKEIRFNGELLLGRHLPDMKSGDHQVEIII